MWQSGDLLHRESGEEVSNFERVVAPQERFIIGGADHLLDSTAPQNKTVSLVMTCTGLTC